MYRAVLLPPSDWDLHRFVWRRNPGSCLEDYRMTRATFGISASLFAANMAVKQNARVFALKYPLAFNAVNESFYVDDGLSGADSVEEAVKMRSQTVARSILKKPVSCYASGTPVSLQSWSIFLLTCWILNRIM